MATAAWCCASSPPGKLLASVHAIDREYRILEALLRTDVPAPRPVLYEADPGAVGTPFYVMERIEGRVFDDPSLTGLASSDRRAMTMARTAGSEAARRSPSAILRRVARPRPLTGGLISLTTATPSWPS